MLIGETFIADFDLLRSYLSFHLFNDEVQMTDEQKSILKNAEKKLRQEDHQSEERFLALLHEEITQSSNPRKLIGFTILLEQYPGIKNQLQNLKNVGADRMTGFLSPTLSAQALPA